MALIRDYELQGGITVPNAYFVITNLYADKILREPAPTAADPNATQLSQKWNSSVRLAVFKDKATREAGGAALGYISSADVQSGPDFTTQFIYDPTLPTLPIVQAYQHLMALSYFNNATVDADS